MNHAQREMGPPLVRWGAVFSGTVIGLGLGLLVASLWVALAFSSHQSVFYNHLAWWLAATAIGAMLLAAMIAARVSGVLGAAAGLANGLTTWGVIVLATAAGGIPGLVAYGATRPITVNGVRIAVTTVKPWTTFLALVIGVVAAAIGGTFGGLTQGRRAKRHTVDVRDAGHAPDHEQDSEKEPVPAGV